MQIIHTNVQKDINKIKLSASNVLRNVTMVNSQIKMENVNLAKTTVKIVNLTVIVKNAKKVLAKLMINVSKKMNTHVPMANLNKIILIIIVLNV